MQAVPNIENLTKGACANPENMCMCRFGQRLCHELTFVSEVDFEREIDENVVEPVLCPFFEEVSDHYGVMSWISFQKASGAKRKHSFVTITIPAAKSLQPLLQGPPPRSLRPRSEAQSHDGRFVERDVLNTPLGEVLRSDHPNPGEAWEKLEVGAPFESPYIRGSKLRDMAWGPLKERLQQRLMDDQSNGHRYLRIYTQNMHFRPYSLYILSEERVATLA